MLGGLSIDIDFEGIKALAAELGATEDQVGKAQTRALKRTAASIRKRASKELRTELGLRNVKALRRRLKETKLRGGTKGSLDQVRIWFGANDMKVSAFKGRIKKTPDGASFRGRAYAGGFIRAKTRGDDVGKRTIFKRVGAKAHPLEEQEVDVADRMLIYVEDVIFPDIGEIFMKHFRADLKARAIPGVE